MKIGAIFSDYDGTLSPAEVPLSESRVPKDVEEALLEIAASVPVAIVTSKDAGFVRPRTRFASAWACASGLDIVLADGRVGQAPEMSARLPDGLAYAKGLVKPGMAIETKRDSGGRLLGFSLDWRRSAPPSREAVASAKRTLAGLGLAVVHDPAMPYLDVFGARPDKGRAVAALKRLLGVRRGVLFLGDSLHDNPAFGEADRGLCVDHGQGLERLTCGYVVESGDLGRLLHLVAGNGLELDLRTLKRRPPARGAQEI